jgi:DNA-binding winged helix-turn-helix (wHTH) protein
LGTSFLPLLVRAPFAAFFGPFSLDPEARVLLRDGEPMPMAGKTLDMLVMLVQNRGRLVDKDELLSRVWAGTIVEEASLSRSIFFHHCRSTEMICYPARE